MPILIQYATIELIPSYHATLDLVARERVYLGMVEAFPLEKVHKFQSDLIARNGPVYYVVEDARVVGWCDVFPEENPSMRHRGCLGMGLLSQFRGRGLGSQLVSSVLDHAKRFGLEKIELNVFTSNVAAIALYKKFGFETEGLIRKFRKLEDHYFDALVMGKMLI